MQYAVCMNYKMLSEIARVSGGYTFRGAVRNRVEGDSFVLQAKDIEEGIVIDENIDLPRVEMDGKGDKSVVLPGDILITNRSSQTGSFAATLSSDSTRRIVASISLHIIRLDSDQVLPEYLVSFFNSSHGQQALQAITTGAVVQSLSIKELRELRISIPDISIQQAIVGLNNISQSQQRLLLKKMNMIKSITNSAITKATQ